MRAIAKFNRPGDIEATVTITTTLEKWQELRDELKNAPLFGIGAELRTAIDEMTYTLNSVAGYETPSVGEEA